MPSPRKKFLAKIKQIFDAQVPLVCQTLRRRQGDRNISDLGFKHSKKLLIEVTVIHLPSIVKKQWLGSQAKKAHDSSSLQHLDRMMMTKTISSKRKGQDGHTHMSSNLFIYFIILMTEIWLLSLKFFVAV